MMKNGRADKGSGDSNNTGGRKPAKKASPPNVGVGRVCHRSFFGCATQPNRAAIRPATGTQARVSNSELAAASQKTALLAAVYIAVDIGE